jgi:hypothetical protein
MRTRKLVLTSALVFVAVCAAGQSVRVAVLPGTYTGPAEHDWTRDALAYGTTVRFDHLSDVSVVRRCITTWMHERATVMDDPTSVRVELDRLLAADIWLRPEASVQGRRVTFSVSVIDPKTGEETTAASRRGSLANPGPAYRRVMRALPKAIGASCSSAERRKLAAVPASGVDAWSSLARGWAVWDGYHGDPARAASLFAGALDADPNCIPAAVGRVIALVDGEDINLALVEAKKLVVGVGEDDASALVAYAHVLWKSGDTTAALDAAERAVRISPSSPSVRYNRAGFLCNAGRYDEALAAADSTLELDRFEARAELCRGIALAELERRDESKAAFERFLELEPESAWSETAMAYMTGEK